MKSFKNWLIGIIMLFPVLVWAQTYSETALLFSRIKPGGSARIQAMGGTQTSLGGDYSSIFSNPAGLGMFNRSEIAITPSYFSSSLASNYGTASDSNPMTENKTNLNIAGLGAIFQTDKDGRAGILSGSFAVSYNRTNNFNQNFGYSGTNDKNSIIDYFIQDANGLDPLSFEYGGDNFNSPTGLAYNNYLIEDSTFLNPNASKYDYMSVMGTFPDPNDIRKVLQVEDVKISGGQSQWSFSYGANISDKIFVGAGLGFSTVRYSSAKTYQESNYYFVLDPEFNPLRSMKLYEELNINGTGVNGTFGVIARPVDGLQVGLSYATPTVYWFTDTYRAKMNTSWNNFDYFNDGKPLNEVSEYTDDIVTEYTLKTPGRLSVGATYFIQKYGFVSADIEMVNYAGAKYSTSMSGISFSSDNDDIKSLYQNTINYRTGGEYRLKNFRFRAGFSYMPDPFKSEQNGTSRKIISYSGGLGYRMEKFYIDFALVNVQGETTYRPYTINSADSPLVTIKNNTVQGLVTLGFPF